MSTPVKQTPPGLVTGDSPPRRRRWIPVSLWLYPALLALLFVGSLAFFAVSNYRQHGVIREVEWLGGDTTTRNRGPAWLHEPLLEELDAITFDKFPATDDILSRIGRITRLRELRLYKNEVTDVG